MPIDKPKLDRTVLENHGISFSEKVYRPESQGLPQHGTSQGRLPEHVESIRKALLRFGALLPKNYRNLFEKEAKRHSAVVNSENNEDCNIKPPDSAYRKAENTGMARHDLRRYSSMRAEEAKTEIVQNEAVAFDAQELADKRASEPTWLKFMSTYIFKEFHDVYPEATGDEYLFDQWALETDAHWNEAHKHANYDESITRPTGPKPDLTYAFPIHKCLNHLAEGFRDDDAVTNFSLKVLGKLYDQGLISAPLTGLSNWVEDSNFDILRTHLMCFPWAVVELKPSMVPKSEIHFAYCQAANATSAALRLFEELLRHVGGTEDRIPPVVAFTCIGPFIRVWLAYSRTPRERSRCHRMVCIWSGTLTTTWGVIATRQIVKNMTFWATRVLRPTLSGYISQIRLNKRLDRSDPTVSPDKLGGINNRGQNYESTQTLSTISKESSIEGDSAAEEHMLPVLQTANSGEIDPAPETTTSKDLSMPQIPIPDTSRGSSGVNASVASSPDPLRTAAFLAPRRILTPKSQRPKTSCIGSFPVSFPQYNSRVGIGNQPTPRETGDNTKTTPPRTRPIVNFPEVEETACQEHKLRHDGQEKLPRIHEDQKSISEPDFANECSAESSGEDSYLYAAADTISEHDPDAPLLGESADSHTNEFRNEINDLTSALSGIDFGPVFKSQDPENARYTDVTDPYHEAWAYPYHVYRFPDTPDWILADALPDSPATAPDDSSSEYLEDNSGSQSSAERSERNSSEYEPSEASTFSVAKDHVDGAANTEIQEESVPIPERNTNESEAWSSDEPSESGDYEPSITDSENSDSSDSSEGETPQDSSGVLDRRGSILNESDTNKIFLAAAEALWGSELVQLETIRNRVDQLSGDRLHDIIWSSLDLIKRSRSDSTTRFQLATREGFLRTLSETIGLDNANTIMLDDLNNSRQWRFVEESLNDIAESNKESLRELCFAALACWDSLALFSVLYNDSRPLSKHDCLSIGREALELIYSQPVQSALMDGTNTDPREQS